MHESERDPSQDPAISAALQSVLAREALLPSKAHVRTLWAEVARRAGLRGANSRGMRSLRRRSPWTSRAGWRAILYPVAGAMAIAAMFLFIIGIGHGKHPRIITYTTDNGQRANILLPDGSTVILNVASRLDLPADFGAAHRALTLHGEGLFTVMHQGGAPFTVTVGQSTIRVLGTTFAVRRYNSDTVTKVAVREGRVAVHAAVVDAHQQVQIDANNTARVSSADPAQFSFATGMLTIDREPLKDAVAELDRWYDVDIRVQDTSVAMHLLQGTFKTGSVNDLAAMLEYTFGVRVVRDGRVLTLIPK